MALGMPLGVGGTEGMTSTPILVEDLKPISHHPGGVEMNLCQSQHHTQY